MQQILLQNASDFLLQNATLITNCGSTVGIQSFYGPYFPAFGVNTKRYGVRKSPNTGTFHAVVLSLGCEVIP